MAEFRKIVRATTKRPDRKGERTYQWEAHLHSFERGKAAFIPVEAFSSSLLVDYHTALKEGVVFETAVHEYDKHCDSNVRVRWLAKIEKLCGLRALCQYIGCNSKFWINMLSEDIYGFASGSMSDPTNTKIVYAPPLSVNREYEDELKNFMIKCIEEKVKGNMVLSEKYDEMKPKLQKPRFRVGQRIELLNYTKSTEIRVARVQATCGRRINVLVMKKDYPGSLPDAEDDRQAHHSGAQYWIDESSFFIFPVGFAAVNKYKLNATPQYIEHSKAIADAIKKGKTPEYDDDDVTFEMLQKKPVDPEMWSQLEVGQKFELIDPLAQQFNELHVASILKFCKTPGYMIVGMDGPDAEEDSFPIHVENAFMFPVGYADKYGLSLTKPDGHKGPFNWDDYLRSSKAEPLPIELFKPMPSEERLAKFKTGMRLEAADMCENQFICPATIKSVHGRIINVNFDGWDQEFDELYDIDSHDILPIGWCELHDYTLQMPKRDHY